MGIRTSLSSVLAAVSVAASTTMAGVVTDRIQGGVLTDGNPGMYATKGPSTWMPFGMPGTRFIAPVTDTLEEYTVNFRGHGPEPGFEPNQVDWNGFWYRAFVWDCGVILDTEACVEYLNGPTNGFELGSVTHSPFTNLVPNGEYVPDGWDPADPLLLYDLIFDVSGAQYTVQEGHTYVIAVVAEGMANLGTVYQSLSDFNDPPPTSDYYAWDNGASSGADDLETLLPGMFPGAPPWFGSRITVAGPVCGDQLCEGDEAATCPEDCNSIPAVSTWGMVTMTLLVLTAGTVVYARRGGRRSIA